jgi:hypothetical protein
MGSIRLLTPQNRPVHRSRACVFGQAYLAERILAKRLTAEAPAS